MIAEQVEQRQNTSTEEGDGLGHGYCALCFPLPQEPTVAICGTPWTDGDWISFDEPGDPCVVCYGSTRIRCNLCGVILSGGAA